MRTALAGVPARACQTPLSTSPSGNEIKPVHSPHVSGPVALVSPALIGDV
jgi:hypothetical protein